MLVKEIMTKNVVTVGLKMSVHELAELFVSKNISGAPVINDQGKLVGVALEEGVIFQDKKVHLPTFMHIAMGFLTFGVKRFEDEVKKTTATKVEDIIEKNMVVLSADTSVEDAATLMLEKETYYCPVVKEDKLIGIVTKKDIVKAIAK
ncbi:MAG: CBS domain-containing protein [Candidatus Omnitrophota bacterium]